jgi:hypothetical protein
MRNTVAEAFLLPILTILQHRRMANTMYESSCTCCLSDEGKFIIAATAVPYPALQGQRNSFPVH